MKPTDQTTDDLSRWRQTALDPGALVARAAALADASREVPPLAPATLARIKAEVLARRAPRGLALPMSLRFAVLTAVLLASVATAKGTMVLWRHFVVAPVASSPAPRAHRHAVAPSRPVASASSPASPSIDVEPSPPTDAPVLVVAPPPVAPAHRAHRAALASAEPRVSEEASTVTTEAQLIGRALARLRQAHDPAGAVALLDQYTRTYPHGALEPEATSARLEAVIQMNDRKAALALLDHRTAFTGRLGAEQLLTRAELRASAGRYTEALADFEHVPGSAGADAERALYGRAVCLGHLGQGDRARADLVSYQQRFPAGPHAAEVTRLLAGGAPRRL